MKKTGCEKYSEIEILETEAVQALKRYLSPQALAEYEAYVLYLNKKAEQ